MESKIMQVFYGSDCLPYKDSARSVHYPIVGNSFIGANNTTQIRFYVRDIGGVNNVSWVAISKLPNGKIGSQVLSGIHLDSELNEYYVALDLSSYYTQLKGDVYISLNGYQGQVQVEQDSDTGIYTIVGTPLIEATGSIKLAINYAPQLPLGQHFNISDLQQVLGFISEKANIVNTVQVVADITQEDLTGYDNGQLFYDLETKQYYEKISESPYYQVAENYAGILGSKRVLVRYVLGGNIGSLQDLYDLIGTKIAIIRLEQLYNSFEDLIYFNYQYPTGPINVRAINLSTLRTQYADLVNTSATNYASMDELLGSFLTLTKYADRILHESNYKDYAVPYTGATDNVDLGGYDIKSEVQNGDGTKKGGFYLNADSSGSSNYHGSLTLSSHIVSHNYGSSATYSAAAIKFVENSTLPQTSHYIYFPTGLTNDSTFATQEWTNSVVATLKTNAFILVNTTTYPTLNDFLASTGEEGYIYLYPSTNEEEEYLKYIWEENSWLMIGTTQIDLTNYYTKSQVDAIANSKVSKTSSAKKIYATSELGNQIILGYDDFVVGNAIVRRHYDGNIYVPDTPDGHGAATSKKYVDDQIDTMGATKVDKSSEHNKVYGTDNSGNQKLFNVDNTVGADGNIVRRASGTSQIMVPLTPTANGHAASKKYVDDSITTAISTVFKYKGTKTVAEINALTGQQVGDVYNVSDSGTLTDGNIQVRAGDNVAWTGTAWDKLAEDIDWSAYDEKFIAAGFFEVDNYNENSGEITFIFATELYDMSYNSDTGVMTIEAN